MPLSILSSNRVETLQKSLCHRLAERLPTNPFAAEIIVVPTYAMARWLNLHIAQQRGIAANIEYPLPAGWVWQLAASILKNIPDQDPLQSSQACWKLFNLLPQMLTKPAFAGLQRYLVDDDQAVKRWQLSNRIATVFDRYQLYRPGLIRDWSAGGGESWQAELWRAMLIGLAESHRVVVIDQLIEQLHKGFIGSLLPERISLFAHSSLPPLLVDVIHALSAHTEITLYQHSPTDQYWADLRNRKSLSRMRLDNPQQAEYFETGNDLLASWGRQGQALQDLMLDNDQLPTIEWESYQPPGNTGLLQSIQQSIFDLDSEPLESTVDGSLSIHVCHSPMRECQVLHDQLLSMIDRDPSLRAEDILVMIPEVSRYAPYIEAVFRPDESRPTLPWNLSDISIADEHPLVTTFLKLLRLADSRFSYSEVIAFLDIDEVRHRYEINEQTLVDIYCILADSRVRWGIDAEHKTRLGLPSTAENTWQQARQRIFAGYAFGRAESWHGIAAIADVDAGRAQSMGKFWLLFERLQYWHKQLSSVATAEEWQARLNRMLGDFFRETSKQETRLQQIRDSIEELSFAGNADIPPALLRHWMEQQLANQEVRGRLFSGGVTFCGMRPMRSLPFRVICLLGMNDGAFPRRENPLEFDAMAGDWRPGDPSKADEDRYLMLETLLCTRQSLYISYCGRSLKDNSDCQPSVLVRELLDFVDDHFSQPGQLLSRSLTRQHPMQAFAASNYQSETRSYDTYWCRIANRLQKTRTPGLVTRWSDTAVVSSADEEGIIRLDELRSFLLDPVKYFFNKSLKLWLSSPANDEDEEPFSLDSLERWNIRQRITNNLLVGQQTSPELLKAEGWLPHGYAALASYEDINNDLAEFLMPLQDYRGLTVLSLPVDYQLNDFYQLNGVVNNYYSDKGLMHLNHGNLKGKHLLALWIDHLAICATGIDQDSDPSLLIARDQSINFPVLEAEQAIAQLLDYIALYQKGKTYPLPVFPLASYAWACKQEVEDKAKAAHNAWTGYSFWAGYEYRHVPGDLDNDYVKLALRGNMPAPFNSAEFESCANLLYTLALEKGINI
jgi:exodeoxyribonuclease V gamma subunit